MEAATSFFISVVAGIVACYICKWLDGDGKEANIAWWVFSSTKEKKNPWTVRCCSSGISSVVHMDLLHHFACWHHIIWCF